MKFLQSNLLLVSVAGLVSAAPNLLTRDIPASLIPAFGVKAGTNPDGTGNCDGIKNAAGKTVKIPCACPPSEAEFAADLAANVAAGHAVHNPGVAISFPTGNDAASLVSRIEASIVTLQNLHGSGQGCPAASTTFSAQLLAAQEAASKPAAKAATPAKSAGPAKSKSKPSKSTPAKSTPSKSATKLAIDPNQVPQFGVTAGTGPDGHGNCNGVNNAQGVPIKIPCSCPPDRQSFIDSLSANVAAGHAIHNPGTSLSFPTGNDKASESTRIEASIITLQNLFGPGVGCPASSTTFVAQQKALA